MKAILKEYWGLIFGLVLITTSYFLYKNAVNIDEASATSNIEQAITQKFETSEKLINDFNLSDYNKRDFQALHKVYQNLYDDEGIFIGAYENGVLNYWSDNKVPVPLNDSFFVGKNIVQLENGWYLLSHSTHKEVELYALALIKTEYLYDNKYLESKFQSDFDYPYNSNIVVDEGLSGIEISYNDEYLFTVVNLEEEAKSTNSNTMLVLMFVIGIVLMIVYLFNKSIQLAEGGKTVMSIVVFIVPILFLRAWTDYDGSPSLLYDLKLFNPDLYAQSSMLPSLGDFMFNVSVIFIISYFVYRLLKMQRTFSLKLGGGDFVVFAIGMLGLFYFSHKINILMSGLVINSQINFDISNLFELSIYSFIGIAIIGLILFTYFILTNVLLLFVEKSGLNLNIYYFVLTIAAGIHLGLSLFLTDYDLLEVFWPIPIILISGMIRLRSRFNYTFGPIVGVLIIFGLFAAHTVLKYTALKERNDRMVYAGSKLANDEDPDTEYQFSLIENELLNSDILQSPFDTTITFDKAQFDHQLELNYFNDRWDQYEITYNVFARDSQPVGLYISSPKDYEALSDIRTRSGMPSPMSSNIYYIPNYDNRLSYLIHLTIPGEDATPKGYLICELKSKNLPKDIGFPELLLNKKNKAIDALAGYSFARYLDSGLVSKLGPYNYSIYNSRILKKLGKNDEYIWFDENGYRHLVYRSGPNNLIILGKPMVTFLEKVTTFSYLFALFSLLLLCAVAIKESKRVKDLRRLSLKNKIQFVVIGLILACLILFGLGTRFFISKQYNQKNNKLISEKIKSVNIEVKKKVGFLDSLENDINFLNSRLHKFSQVFFTDITMYDTKGDLLATSRHEIFNSGLLGRKIDPKAFIELSKNQRSEFIQEEKVGNMSYLSAYVPFVNERGKILGYLNLPYFAKQNPLENEISEFMVAIINIFVVLFALSIVAALFVSNWVTKPLKLLQTSVSNIEFGKANERIQYTGQDEIGDLVQEYNKKVEDLETAANQLARSERESAWRDMAKQVAHEIKNPLTPMKLSVQHFQRSFDKNEENAEERIERFSQTLIEQIDTLTNIANEFSNFAKMPAAQVESINLVDLLTNTVQLFAENDSTQISFINNCGPSAIVEYDKDHLLRVFNNLVKNALQAIPHEKEGHIDVILSLEKDKFLVEVKDNGTGISGDKQDKIFVPNFTTKSKGMGLGLSMVKSIVENAGGSVWFETVPEKGTSFFVKLPGSQRNN